MAYFEDENFHATQKSGKKTIIRGGLELKSAVEQPQPLFFSTILVNPFAPVL